MRRHLITSLFGAALCWAPSALACGGGFGQGLQVSPAQKIVIRHDAGIESYTFSPHFCGTAKDFGLILPIPSTLSENPKLGSAELVPQLDKLSAPNIEKKTECKGSFGGTGGGSSGGLDAGSNGVNVINAGQVGMFDYTLLQADTPAAFTDWLDANGYPYDAGASAAFDYYVSKGWYFVAFRVTASDAAPPAGSELCGDLGPLTVSFAADPVVVPARIAAIDESSPYAFGWQVYSVGSSYVSSESTEVSTSVKYADVLTAADLAQYPELAGVAAAGDHITKLNIAFWGSDITQDITLVPNAQQQPFRDTEYEYTLVDCDAGAAGAAGSIGVGGSAGMAGAGGAPNGAAPSSGDDGGCAVSPSPSTSVFGFAALGAALALLLGRRRRH
jgi:MYXO-CTERM domain-containing protein